MALTWMDGLLFLAFVLTVLGVSLYAGKKGQGSEDYFLAGRKLTWPLIGFSLIAANISTEHFVGMAGQAFGETGLAIASYEWMSAVTLVVVAWFLLPRFLSAGIYTMPEFLEYRYDTTTRSIMASYMMVAYVVVLLATVVYSGAVALNAVFGISGMFEARFGMEPEQAHFWALVASIWIIGIIAGAYTTYGGLSSVVWADLLQCSALLLGAGIVLYYGLQTLGDGSVLAGWRKFTSLHTDKLHVVRPWNDPNMPWIAVFIGGLWIPNIFYWGLNQFITQRTLGAKSLAEGQKGVLFGACLKLTIPFLIVMPGIIAYDLYGNVIQHADSAYPYMLGQILPQWVRGIMLAALAGAVISTFNSGLNSAATIFTIDFYQKHLVKDATPKQLVRVGRIATVTFVLIACVWAPMIYVMGEGVFNYIQEFWGFFSPGIVAAFIGGLVWRRAPALAAKVALVVGPVIYACCRVPGWFIKPMLAVENGKPVPPDGLLGFIYRFSTMTFLHHMAIVFLVIMGIIWFITRQKPLEREVVMPRSQIDLTPDPMVKVFGVVVVLLTATVYYFWW
ncbi:MAG TPA: solute:sodium symporter family transporter [Candidatus Hydrogenedentes bacterium]|nr:solute:sodium symporter family transporter [Candidatus Hydrogenedentota bacterium]